MPTSNNLATYPQWFFTIAERAMKDGYREELPLTSRGAAINLRQRWYTFRRLLVASGHPHAAGANSLIVTLKDATLTFTQLGGLTEEAMQKLNIDPATMPSVPASERISDSDAAEDLLDKMLAEARSQLEKGRAPETSGSQESVSCPPHEWDELKTRCIRCGVPYAE